MDKDDYTIKFDMDAKEFYFEKSFLTCRRCYVYDHLKDEIARDNEPILEGLYIVRELSAFFPGRFSVVLIPDVPSDDIPF